MAIAPVEKILIALHKSEEQRFLKCLQSLGVLHISHKQTVTPQNTQISLKETVDELYSVIEYLAEFQKKRNALISEKTPLTRREFETQGTNYKLLETLNEIKTYYTKIQQLEQKLKAIDSEVKFLKPWIKLKYDLSQLYGLKHLETIIGTFHSETDFKETINKISRYPVYYEIINQEKNDYYTIILIPKELFSTVYPLLDKIEIVNLRKYQGTISEIIVQNQKLCNHITNEIDEYYKKLQIISNELPKFKVIYDYYNNLLALEEIKNSLVITKEVIFIEGWIKSKDKSKLKSLTDEFNSVVFTNLPVTENDQIPVALENHKIFKPFEIILDLYTMPQPYEIDPTPLLAPFFTIFFALCLTDAGYGILLTVLSILLLKKLNVSNKFLNLLAICGGITIIAGMLTGSWFGDIFDKIGIDFLVRIKNSLTAFDPIKNPLPFFYLSLAIGFIHLNYGIIIEIYDLLRQKSLVNAFIEQLPWLILINSIVGISLVSKHLPPGIRLTLILLSIGAISIIVVFTRRNKEFILNQIFWCGLLLGLLIWASTRLNMYYPSFLAIIKLTGKILIVFSLFSLLVLAIFDKQTKSIKGWLKVLVFVTTIILFICTVKFHLHPIIFILLSIIVLALDVKNRRLIKNFIWGLYNLYNGTGFLGIILSYIRLMALGMVTAGIAMAINTIAWMIIKIPVIGILLALIVLAIGHLYNFLINILGAFVHSLRLNYVEFFPRFFTGGGEKFVPFREETKYVTIIEGGKL